MSLMFPTLSLEQRLFLIDEVVRSSFFHAIFSSPLSFVADTGCVALSSSYAFFSSLIFFLWLTMRLWVLSSACVLLLSDSPFCPSLSLRCGFFLPPASFFSPILLFVPLSLIVAHFATQVIRDLTPGGEKHCAGAFTHDNFLLCEVDGLFAGGMVRLSGSREKRGEKSDA